MNLFKRVFGSVKNESIDKPKLESVNKTESIEKSELKPQTEEIQLALRRNKTVASAGASYTRQWTVNYDGEKNDGEIGPIINYKVEFLLLSNRSWQSYLESDISQTVINRYIMWIVDKGLKLQSTPDKLILESEGIRIDVEKFNNMVEARFKAFSKSKRSSYNGMKTFNEIAKLTFRNSKIGGDALVILRYENKRVSVQLLDGRHVMNTQTVNPDSKNKIKNGVEIDVNSRHVGYWVKTVSDYQFIPAWDKVTGLRCSFLVYGSEYRLEDERGLPKISVSLETISKTDRYKEATTSAAEQRAKVPYFFENNAISDEANPLGSFALAFADDNQGQIPTDEAGNIMANTVSARTGNQAFNLTKGQTVKALDAKAETAFKEFYGTNADIVCSAVGIPPNVAFSIYNDSFSASRAATKDWDHTMLVERDDFYNQFYCHVYAFWLHYEILNSRISAPGYLKAFYTDMNYSVVEAYLNCEFVGPLFPHIDPLKEVKAERAKLGPKSDNIPLTTIEQATANVGSGESTANILQYAREIELADENGLIDPVAVEPLKITE